MKINKNSLKRWRTTVKWNILKIPKKTSLCCRSINAISGIIFIVFLVLISPRSTHFSSYLQHAESIGFEISQEELYDENVLYTSSQSLFATPKNTVKVYTGLYSAKTTDKDRKRSQRKLQSLISSSSSSTTSWEFIPMDTPSQRAFLQKHGHYCNEHSSTTSTNQNDILEIYDKLIAEPWLINVAQELWKYCAFTVDFTLGSNQVTSTTTSSNSNVIVAYIDIDSPVLVPLDETTLDLTKNYAALADKEYFSNVNLIHGSFLLLQQSQLPIVKKMIQFIIGRVQDDTRNTKSIDISKRLHTVIQDSIASYFNSNEWVFLNVKCEFYSHVNYKRKSDEEPFVFTIHRGETTCPKEQEYCCEVTLPNDTSKGIVGSTLMTSRHYLLPYEMIPESFYLPKPFACDDSKEWFGKKQKDETFRRRAEESLPYITTITETIPEKKTLKDDKKHNFYHILNKHGCNDISNHYCRECMKRSKPPGNCKTCKRECKCLCKSLCKERPAPKPVSKIIHFKPPKFQRDETRLIPRILHQTYFEKVGRKRYPNFSRLIQSWQQHGWDYRFYEDMDAMRFIEIHFPKEVSYAFDSLNPGAFKADLFRLCALFIEGGVYADVDVMVSSKLDTIIQPDIGFMSPLDQPGGRTGHRMCLWNGFIASAPGHPFIGKAIEMIVNHVRNRFTTADTMDEACPVIDFFLTSKFNQLFTTGPCLLGGAINKYLGRNLIDGMSTGEFAFRPDDNNQASIPGRTIILEQNKKDMGSQTFTFSDENVIVAMTDMPNSNDRLQSKKQPKHYSKLREHSVYGLKGVYGKKTIFHENIQIRMDE